MTIELVPLPSDRIDGWLVDVRERLRRVRDESGLRPGADAEREADALIEAFLPGGEPGEATELLAIVDGDRELGEVWLQLPGAQALLVDLHLFDEPDAQERDEVMTAIEETALSSSAASLAVLLFAGDDRSTRLLDGRDYEVSSIQMVLDPLPNRPEQDARVRVEPMTEERFARFSTESERHFAEELAGTGRMSKLDAVAEARRQFAKELPEGLATAGQALFTAEAGGEEVGILWLALRERDGAPHAFILDVAVAEGQRRRGYGRALMHAAERETARLGAASLGLHVFGANAGAVALYENLGYQRLEELRIRLLS